MTKQLVHSNIKNKKFWFLFLSSLFFVNSSLIGNSKIQISFFLFYAFIIIYKKLYMIKLRDDSKILLFFLFSLYISQLANFGFLFLDKTITQLINFSIYIFTYIVMDNFITSSKIDTDYLLNKLFNIFTFIALLSILFYLIGLMYPGAIYEMTHFINNSGSFSVGGIVSSFGFMGPPRLNTFTPEPSFIGFLLAINIAIGFSLDKNMKVYLFINTLALILTISRTGYLMYILLLLFTLYGTFHWKIKIIVKTAGIISIAIMISIMDWNGILNFDDSFTQRFDSIITSFEIVKSNPVFGIGMGAFDKYAISLGLHYTDIFNLYLHLFVSAGFISLSSFVFFLYYIFRASQKKYRGILLVIYVGWGTFSAYNILLVWFLFTIIKTRKNL